MTDEQAYRLAIALTPDVSGMTAEQEALALADAEAAYHAALADVLEILPEDDDGQAHVV